MFSIAAPVVCHDRHYAYAAVRFALLDLCAYIAANDSICGISPGGSASRATLSDSGVTVSADVTFADTGEIVTVSAQRYRNVGGGQILTPWCGHYSDYVLIEGMMVPQAAYVEWIPPEGMLEDWRGGLVKARYTIF